MRRIAVCSFMVCCGLFLPFVVDADTLPADGGDPGKAYKACLEAVQKPDKAAIVDLCFAKDDPWIKKTNVDYFSKESFQVEVRVYFAALRMIDLKINGGKIEGDQAEINVEGTMLLQREESTGDIIEVDRYPVKGIVKFRRTDAGWRYAGQELQR